MYRVGRDGLKFLNLKTLGMKADDIVIWSFGEIDVRTHIGRIRDSQAVDVQTLLERLVCRYLSVAIVNRELIPGIQIVISSVIPPSEKITREDHTLPFYGTLDDRVGLTRSLNSMLEKFCSYFEFAYVDVYNPFAGSDGALPIEMRADLLHLDRRFVTVVKTQLERALGYEIT